MAYYFLPCCIEDVFFIFIDTKMSVKPLPLFFALIGCFSVLVTVNGKWRLYAYIRHFLSKNKFK